MLLEFRLAVVAPGKRMGAFHGPVDVVGDMREERCTVAVLEALEQAAHFFR